MKKKYDFIMVVLVYKNYNDLKDLIVSTKNNLNNYKIIIVNAFFDEESNEKIKIIAEKNDCDFISVENKGYSYGNNCGIMYAKKHYIFKYLIVSNPDTIINNVISVDTISEGDIIAPKIIARNKKNQNPMHIKENKFPEYITYKGYKKNMKLLVYLGIFVYKVQNKIIKFWYSFIRKKTYKIFAGHGSFVIFSSHSLDILNYKPYDENVFLFCEESILAYKSKKLKLNTIYNPSIFISHKEDGSMKLSNISIYNEISKSCIYYYENYVRQK